MVTRRGFLGTGLAACGGYLLPREVFAADGRPLMTFGVVSDVHIGGRTGTDRQWEGALKWLNARGADAVLVPGDFAHTGHIGQMETLAQIWFKVFPGGKGFDGRPVKLMPVTGNHEWENWLWKNKPEELKLKHWFAYKNNPHEVWERLFGEKWEPVWRYEVRGVTFFGAQWPTFRRNFPSLETYMARQRPTIDPAKPFFFIQHAHPKGTCHRDYCETAYDRGESVQALSSFPNAVTFSGHSHCSIADERAVWQGAFTSIGAGCLHEGGTAFSFDNGTARWHPSYKTKLMAPLNDAKDAWGGDPDGGCFEFVEVYADHIIVHRRSSVYDAAIAPAWVIPIPAKKDGKFAYATRKATRSAPQFADGAKLEIKVCPKGCVGECWFRRGEPCVRVVIPSADANPKSRVFSYGIEVSAGGRTVVTGKVFAAGFSVPESEMNRPTEYLVALKDLPAGDIDFTVTPRESFGVSGRPIQGRVKVERIEA